MLRLLLPLVCWVTPAGAECRLALALALAVDVSRSIDALDYVIQTEGMAAALQDAEVRAAERPEARLPTALGAALVFGAGVMSAAPPCARRVLDVAGDGRNNEGISAHTAYMRADFTQVVVNAVAVGEHEQDVARYFRDEVIRGPGAFVELAPRQVDYPTAIRRKLLRELEGPKIGDASPVALGQPGKS